MAKKKRKKVPYHFEGSTLVVGTKKPKKPKQKISKEELAELKYKIKKPVRYKAKKELKELEEVSKAAERKGKVISRLKEKLFTKAKGEKKRIAARAKGASKLLTAMGVVQAKKKGAGRPHKSYKYGMPIQEWKRQQTIKRSLYAQYQSEQQMKLRRRGLTREQVAQLQQIRTAEEFAGERRVPIQAIRRRPTRRPQIQRQTKVSNEQGYPQPPPNVADDELKFRKWMADRTVSPNTQRLLTQIRRIQNKGKVDNIEQQRRHWERKLVGSSMNLMRAHENMNPVKLDFTGVNDEENILMAPSVFKENRENNILRTNKLNLMQTREAGNNLQFF